MKLYVLYYQDMDDYYSSPGVMGIFSSMKKAELARDIMIEEIKNNFYRSLNGPLSSYDNYSIDQQEINVLKWLDVKKDI